MNEIRSIADLTHDPKNARRHTSRNVGMIEKALGEVGAARSIVVDENGVVLAGNATIEAAAAAGIERVQVVDADGQTIIAVRRSGLSPEQKAHLALYDNRASELAEWDTDVLADLGAEIDLSGFWTKDELAALIVKDRPSGGGDDVPDVQEGPTRVQPNELWRLGEHRLLCGDSTKREDVERLMQGDTGDLLLTDPPYGKLKIFAQGTVIGVENAAKRKQYNPSHYHGEGEFRIEPVLEAIGNRCKHRVIWGGNYFTNVLPVTTAWLVWDKRAGERAYFSDCELAWSNLPTGARVFAHMWQGMIRAGEHVDRDHPTQKPVELMVWILRDLAPHVQVVLDLFGGSGTTLLACERERRQCRMMELSEHYCDVILKRYEAESGQQAERID